MVCLICSTLAVILLLGILLKISIKLNTAWCRSQTCLVGKTAIVTGANTGIGYETALDFAKRGARVILACQDRARAENARAKIIQETGNENVVVRIINLASFKSVREFAKNINETEDRLDILVNNAAIAGIDDEKSEDGHMLLMQINHFSPSLLTLLLIGLLKKTGRSRVVNVASDVARFARRFDINKVDEYPGRVAAYPNSKLCNILFTIELAKKLEGTGVTTYSLHPGAIKTELVRHVKGFLRVVVDIVSSLFFKTCEEGAQTTIYCSVAKGIEQYNGEYFDRCRKAHPHKTVKVPGLSRKLWELTLDIIQLRPEEIQV